MQIRHSFFEGCSNYWDIYKKYVKMKFQLRRIELGEAGEQYLDLIVAIQNEKISKEALIEIIFTSVIEKDVVVKRIEEIYKKCGREKEAEYWQKIYQIVSGKAISVAYSRRT